MIGRTISHYRIVEELGRGGMGVVYKAHDTALERDVALKFLPAHLSASSQDKARFIQEAKAAATLNHPNICTIHTIEEHEGQLFIAMQYVDGQLLRDRMRGMSQKQALEVGIQVAEGLAAAHEKGVVHRDIKPENIMVRKDGIAQIMDFGLAKLKGVSRLTKEGSTVGTAGYMSPEQIQGQDADHRSDIFSLGVLLYEMLTGQLPFKGVHETAIAYEIVNVDATPMGVVKPEVDPELDRIVLECLEKEPAERFQSGAEIAKELKRYKRESSRQRTSRVTTTRPAINLRLPAGSGGAPENRRKLRPGYVLAVLLSIVIVLLLLDRWRGESTVSRVPVRSHINLPDEGPFVGSGSAGVVISPDGKFVIYTGRVVNGTQLFLHQMDQLSSKPIPGTENATDLAFSPDGTWIVFSSADQKIVKVSLQGGAPEIVCAVVGQLTRGLCWGADNMILVGMISNSIFSVPANGGTLQAVSKLDSATGEISHRYPQLLPDGNTIIYVAKQNNITTFDEALIVAQRLDTGERKIVVRGGASPKYVSSGHLAYVRGNHILAVPFDIDRLEVTGSSVAVEVGGYMNRGSGGASFDISRNGTMVFAASTQDAMATNVTLAWLDRSGATHSLLDTMRSYQAAALSPDGQKVAVTINAANNDLWVYHISRRVLTRLTFGGGNHDWPRWSPDGRFIIYSAERYRAVNLFRKPWDGSGTEERLTNNPNAQVPVSQSPDGKLLVYMEGGDLWVLPIGPADGNADEKPAPFIQSPATESGGFVSPDGRWIAYLSSESGKSEVYVTAFPKHEGKWQVSIGGARRVFWSRNGKELFFVSGTALMGASILPGPTFDFSQPRRICEIPASAVIHDVSLDGTRFLVTLRTAQQQPLTQLQIVTEWFEAVKSKFSGNAN